MKLDYYEVKEESWLAKKILLKMYRENPQGLQALADKEDPACYNVTMTVDGKEIKFLEVIKEVQSVIDNYMENINEHIDERAKEIVKEKYEGFMDIISNITNKAEGLKEDISFKLDGGI